MNKQPTRRSSLFLMELIIAILFFSLAATVCVRFFVKSYTLEQESQKLNHAVNAATSVAEIFRNQEQPFSLLAEEYPYGEQAENAYYIYYDINWSLCTSSNAVYSVLLQTTETDTFIIGNITVTDNENTLYHLTIKKYIEKEVPSIENEEILVSTD